MVAVIAVIVFNAAAQLAFSSRTEHIIVVQFNAHQKQQQASPSKVVDGKEALSMNKDFYITLFTTFSGTSKYERYKQPLMRTKMSSCV